MSKATVPLTLNDDSEFTSEILDFNEAGRAREQDVRHLSDDNEEVTAEANVDDEVFGTIDEESWDGLVETAYSFHLQLAPSISCPICFQFAAHQDCGHVLCCSCIQQSRSVLNDCSLCQAQVIFRDGKIEAVSGSETMELSSNNAGQDFHLPILSLSMFLTPYQGAMVKLDPTHCNNTNYSKSIGAAVSTGYDMSWM
ncbi:unnamed protein product [Peronospora destructor]|uniref:RING-type domain-containing protein n=1 Tax=Peronospora destructor TaxID=86335 RepID=A0AAV0U7U7_9STRA|nr:unnamed protein product [Peronospora destructor]